MKRQLLNLLLSLSIFFIFHTPCTNAQGWEENYTGVMLQGFYWDSFTDTRWTKLEKQADELANYFDLVWIPQSACCGTADNMGYMPLYCFMQESSFGSEKELRKMISTFKSKGVGTIADVVVNHRGTYSTMVDFPEETYKGVTYQMFSTDICKNDDGGNTLNWANSNGCQLSQNNDTGEGWDGGRDIDHKSENVNKCVKAYLQYLINDLGYSGFRYDMVKGYSPGFTAEYNAYANPQFSVGECWDGTTTIRNWINGTKVDDKPMSAAFDFQFRYRVRDAINQNNWTRLSAESEGDAGKPLIFNEQYRRYAVTFVENHDTEKRQNSQQDPIKTDTLAANAYLLAMPGTPCIFLKHWMAAKGDIKRMITARKLVGIHNQSSWQVMESKPMYYAVKTQGNNGELICVVGKTPAAYKVPDGFTEVLAAANFKYYISNELTGEWNDRLQAIVAEEVAIKQQQQSQPSYTPHKVTVYVRSEVNWAKMNFYIWDSNNNTQLNGNWPGKQITDTKTINGYDWYYQTFDFNSEDYYVNVVFNTNTGSPQTLDATRIYNDQFFVIRNVQRDGKYVLEYDTQTRSLFNTDVNEDGSVDISDVVATINHIAGTASFPKSDVNGDGTTDISDVVAIINFMAGN